MAFIRKCGNFQGKPCNCVTLVNTPTITTMHLFYYYTKPCNCVNNIITSTKSSCQEKPNE